MVVALHLIEADATQMSGIDSSMTPKQHASTILIPFLNRWCCSLHIGRDVPNVAFAHTLKVAQPEEHTVGLYYIDRSDGAERNELSRRIGLVQPQPGRSLIVIALLYQFLWRSIDAQETDGRLTDTERSGSRKRCSLVIFGHQLNLPRVTCLHIADGITLGRARECFIDRTLAIGGCQQDARSVSCLVPLYECIVATGLVNLTHLNACNRGCAFTGISLDHTCRDIVTIRDFEYILKRHIGRNILVGIAIAADCLAAREGTVAIDSHSHLTVL